MSDGRQTDLFKPVEYQPTGPTETVVFVRTENAVAMYLRGQLVYDSSFISRENVLNALGIKHSTHEADELWWSSQAGCEFPEMLNQVVLSKEE